MSNGALGKRGGTSVRSRTRARASSFHCRKLNLSSQHSDSRRHQDNNYLKTARRVESGQSGNEGLRMELLSHNSRGGKNEMCHIRSRVYLRAQTRSLKGERNGEPDQQRKSIQSRHRFSRPCRAAIESRPSEAQCPRLFSPNRI